MRILISVQGEGRGHLTQAMAATQRLRRMGHEICSVIVGETPHRPLPQFFYDFFGEDFVRVPSPSLSIVNNKSISPLRTGIRLLRQLPKYRSTADRVSGLIRDQAPDIVLNFYEPVTGWAKSKLKRDGVPMLSIGHQFMLDHPKFVRSNRFPIQRRAMRLLNSVVSARSPKLALSFYEASDVRKRRIFVCPPLLREEFIEPANTSPEDFYLIYLLNPGYMKSILRWHKANPGMRLRCYSAFSPEMIASMSDRTLTLHALDAVKFREDMARCRGLACTAGFESVCEAALMGKPVMVVPVKNHVEQYLNSVDAQIAGIAVRGKFHNLSPLLSFKPRNSTIEFRHWVERTSSRLEEVMRLVIDQWADYQRNGHHPRQRYRFR